MAKAKTVVLKGQANWAKVFESNRDMEGYAGAYKGCDGAYTIDLITDLDTFSDLKLSGSMKKGNPTDDGMQVKFVRKHKGPFEDASGPPVVLDEEGNPWDFEDRGIIGNGSEVEVTVSVYPIKRFSTVGTRLEKVRVLKHVEYDAPSTDGTGVAEGDEVTV